MKRNEIKNKKHVKVLKFKIGLCAACDKSFFEVHGTETVELFPLKSFYSICVIIIRCIAVWELCIVLAL